MATWSKRTPPARARLECRPRRAIAAIALAAAACLALPARAFVVHPAVTVRATAVDFYSGHLVLDARGNATLDDGVLHVAADRIQLDLTSNRYVAAGNVMVSDTSGRLVAAPGVALGIDLATHKGVLIALSGEPATFAVDGAAVSSVRSASSAATVTTAQEPLALPDTGDEQPFVRAARAVAHLGADVRLGSARVLVPGGKDVFIPSYVYTFSSDVGYSQSNISGTSEDVPIYFGSTRNSVDGAHFMYNPVTKVGLGLDHKIVDGDKAYDLFSVSPLNGPRRTANFTWQEQINGHSTQTLNGAAFTGFTPAWSYEVTDSVHRSYFDLSGRSGFGTNSATLSWQGTSEPLGAGWLGNSFNFRLRSEYGRSQQYFSATPTQYHTAIETLIQTPSMVLNESTALFLSADFRETFVAPGDRHFTPIFGATLQHRWSHIVTTSLTDEEQSSLDHCPSCVTPAAPGFAPTPIDTTSRVTQQIGTLSYDHGDPLSFSVSLTHQSGYFTSPGISPQEWFAFADVRFRVTRSLSLDLNRSYGFGFNGQRFGSLGFQIFP